MAVYMLMFVLLVSCFRCDRWSRRYAYNLGRGFLLLSLYCTDFGASPLPPLFPPLQPFDLSSSSPKHPVPTVSISRRGVTSIDQTVRSGHVRTRVGQEEDHSAWTTNGQISPVTCIKDNRECTDP